jgi:hypothetical protein
MFRKICLLTVSAMLSHAALAAVTADEAKQLRGDKLTAFGAEKAGNKEGTIPPYTGKGAKAPASYDLKDPGQRPSPYAGEKPLFTITAQNAAQYADKLDGLSEVFKRYPAYRMDVYPTHRDYVYPPYVLENTIKNATSCKGVNQDLKLEGCYGGVPFPLPKNGNEVMWNHLLYFGAHANAGNLDSTLTPADGRGLQTARTPFIQQFDNYDPKNTKPLPSDVTYWRISATYTAPARSVGSGLILIDSLDMVDKGRRAYQYIPGQRRVKLSPNLAYDTPNPTTGGSSVMDEGKVFLGALDRFDFKLVGKKEKFIPYNNFGLTYGQACSRDKIVNNKNFPNPDCIRWELHRVWQVEATLKPGFRHIYQKRVFFWDEDTAGTGVSENYDAAGKLYRMVMSISYPFYENDFGMYAEGTIAMDMQTGAWISNGLATEPGMGVWLSPPQDDRAFSPEALAGQGVR